MVKSTSVRNRRASEGFIVTADEHTSSCPALDETSEPCLCGSAEMSALRGRIQKLAVGEPMWSRSARTHKGTEHCIFEHGAFTKTTPIGQLADRVYEDVRLYRERISGDAHLVWRVEPEYRTEGPVGAIYTRLCFEPVVETSEPGREVVQSEWLKLVEAEVGALKTRLQQLGPSREVSLALTKADEALLWARESVRSH